MGYFCKKICNQEVKKIAQSSHTARETIFLLSE